MLACVRRRLQLMPLGDRRPSVQHVRPVLPLFRARVPADGYLPERVAVVTVMQRELEPGAAGRGVHLLPWQRREGERLVPDGGGQGRRLRGSFLLLHLLAGHDQRRLHVYISQTHTHTRQ